MSFTIYVSTMNNDDKNMLDRAVVERAFRDIAVDQTGGYWNLRSPDGRIASLRQSLLKTDPKSLASPQIAHRHTPDFPNSGMRFLRYCLRRTPFCFGQRRKAHIQDVVSLILLYCLISQVNGLMRWANPQSSRLVLKLKRPSR